MDPNTNQPQTPVTPVTPIPEIKQSEPVTTPVENAFNSVVPEQQPIPTPEVPKTPESVVPEKPPAPEIDHISAVAPLADQIQTIPANPPAPTDDDYVPTADVPVAEPEKALENAINDKYIKTADDVIEQLEDKPFEEEEKAEDLQIGYLKDRFGKIVNKSEEE